MLRVLALEFRSLRVKEDLSYKLNHFRFSMLEFNGFSIHQAMEIYIAKQSKSRTLGSNEIRNPAPVKDAYLIADLTRGKHPTHVALFCYAELTTTDAGREHFLETSGRLHILRHSFATWLLLVFFEKCHDGRWIVLVSCKIRRIFEIFFQPCPFAEPPLP